MRKKGIPEMELKKRPKKKSGNSEWKTPWKTYNPNCAKCRYRNDERIWASLGTCNFAGVTGKPRIAAYKVKDCPGFPGERIIKRNRNPLDM